MLDWAKILKWLLLIAFALTLVAVPVVYARSWVASLEKAAYSQGYNTKQHEDDLNFKAQEVKKQVTMETEAEQAKKRLEDNAKFNTKVKTLQAKLVEAQQASPAPVNCVANVAVTSLLRSAAEGGFDIDTSPITGRPPAAMSDLPPVSSERNN